MLILLWGLENDPPLIEVRDQLELLRVPTFFIDQRRVLETEIEVTTRGCVDGFIKVGEECIDLAEVTAMYVRAYEAVRLPEIATQGPASADWQHAEQVDDILATWSELTPALVVNRFSASAANGSKPYQLQQIRAAGWSVPETLITTDAATAQSFWQRHGSVIYKSISAVRSRVSRLTPEHAPRFADLAWCPRNFSSTSTASIIACMSSAKKFCVPGALRRRRLSLFGAGSGNQRLFLAAGNRKSVQSYCARP